MQSGANELITALKTWRARTFDGAGGSGGKFSRATPPPMQSINSTTTTSAAQTFGSSTESWIPIALGVGSDYGIQRCITRTRLCINVGDMHPNNAKLIGTPCKYYISANGTINY